MPLLRLVETAYRLRTRRPAAYAPAMANKATARDAADTLSRVLEALPESELVADAPAANPRGLVARNSRITAALNGAVVALRQASKR